METVVRQLFPTQNEVNTYSNGKRLPNIKEVELRLGCSKLKSNKAPGPELMPPKIVKYVSTDQTEYALSVYNKLAIAKQFPEE